MDINLLGFKRAQILSYDPVKRTARIHIHGLTDGASEGLTATFAYAVGEDDRDTEIKILGNNKNAPDVFVFFENNEISRPVIAFFSSHGINAETDVRRIKQKNIEVLASSEMKLEAEDMHIKAGRLYIDAEIIHEGNQKTTGTITATEDVVAGNVSVKTHPHSGIRSGNEESAPPVPTVFTSDQLEQHSGK
ncbi:hypothetical protein [Acinetobacter chinensis]|uniref:hypothetical protein n=1 Tax=Acinetobacter chinensis TaxID=2004650 RepID=UPI0029342A16|nr:hypothetical protein [Acinetobacter chinensis]WOE40050.1 hypothetical protein QSG87_09000 [Acinetobacter chinensis]